MKPFRLGFMIGRFQHFHIGHKRLVDTAISVCENLLIGVGSSQEKGTVRNPYSVGVRTALIKNVYACNRNVHVFDVPDLTHENDHSVEWGKFLLKQVNEYRERYDLPELDLMVYGNDEERQSWFDPADIEGVSHLVVSRKDIPISATKMRRFLVNDQYEEWQKFAPHEIHYFYELLRYDLLKIPEYKELAKRE